MASDYESADKLLRDSVGFTLREIAVAELCVQFKTATGVEMTKVGRALPDVLPTDGGEVDRGYVGRMHNRFREKVLRAGVTMLYGHYHGLFDAEELDEMIGEAGETAAFLLGDEAGSLPDVRDRREMEDLAAMLRELHEASIAARHDTCPDCGHELDTHD